MKKQLLFLLATLCVAGNTALAQRNSREDVKINLTHIPALLVYDQIKTYAYDISLRGERHAYVPSEVRQAMPTLSSFKEVAVGNADMKVSLDFGPFTVVENRIVSETRTREVDKKKETYTVYYVVFSAKYDMELNAVNVKNGKVLFRRYEETEKPNLTYKGDEFSTSDQAGRYWNDRSGEVIGYLIKQAQDRFISSASWGFKASFDFYPTTESAVFYTVKKVDFADQFNGNVTKVMETLKAMTSDESPKIYRNKLSGQLSYFESLKDQYSPTDKKMDVIYSAVNFNLASLSYCLDDFENATLYLERLKAVKDNEAQKRELTGRVEHAQKAVKKHFLDNRHLDYNPVVDFQLEGKPFVSDAMSSVEKQVKNIAEGGAPANDTVLFATDEVMIGKVVFDDIKRVFNLIPTNDPTNPIPMTPSKVTAFSCDKGKYCTVKQSNGSGGLVRHFALARFESAKVKMLEKTDGSYNPNGSFMVWSSTQELPFEFEMGFKKTLSKYLGDCDAVAVKVKDGDYGNAFSLNADKVLSLCKDYSACGN